ncbi:hypothetical protein [uncultured Microbacterium sp.]|uniref:hypothetical protein n=1 Tax=uncultured Microbacterium sp. TaxID=191216 RepID=UPI0035CAC5EA
MRILLKFVIDCDADAAWRAVHSPRAVAELYGPLLAMAPVEPSGLPTTWGQGSEVAVNLSLAGIVPMGRQLIHASDRFVDPDVRIFRDSGIPLTGPLAALDVWDHQMAVAPAPGDPTKTLWRDRLVIGGRAAPALWPVMWATWQWRGARIRAMAPTWAYDLPDAEEPPA